MLVVAIVFILLLLIGIPIAFVLGISGLVHLVTINDPMYFKIITQRLFSGVDSFSLMAIPFFILAGELMNRGKITQNLVDFGRECVGFINGGLAHVTILVGMFLSAILGSANAVAAILCSVMVPEMKKDGYDEEFAAGVIAACSIIGPIIPPSVIFVLYGVLSGTSVSALFLAGIVPGVLLGVGYMIISARAAKVRKYPKYKEKIELDKLFKSFIKAIPALLVPFIIIGGVLSGVFTPTESGAVAVAVAFISGTLIYRSLDIKELPKILLNTGMITSAIMIIIALGNILGWTLAIDKIPGKLASGILGMTTNPKLVLLLIIIGMLFVGTVMEAFASMVIFVPVLSPLAAQVGIDPVHFGVVFSIVIAIALITPPVGMALFVTSNITEIPLSKINKEIIPFVVMSTIVLLIVAYIPEICMFLPKLFLK